MPEKFLDTSLLDKAIIFATNAHKNTERRGKGFPYIVHILEVVAIVATMTNDQELLAAGALHDTVEDCGVTFETIEKEFGSRVMEIVKNESDVVFKGQTEKESWRRRKEIAIDRLAKAPHDSKIVALGDKLSNMRAIAQDFGQVRDKVWEKFHASDPRQIEWYYRGLANSLKELENENAYKEFIFLINKVFLNAGDDFLIEQKEDIIYLKGKFNRQNSLKLESMLNKGHDYILDFTGVGSINFSGMRTLLRMKENGVGLSICNVLPDVALRLYETSIDSYIPITELPRHITLDGYTRSGEGFTANSYFSNDEDSMMKLYFQGVALKDIQVEKKKAYESFLLGVPTPMSGDIITHDGAYGITFERIMNKKSFARMLGDDPSRSDELAKLMADVTLKLHNIPCNVNVFPSEKALFAKAIMNFTPFTSEERNKAMDFLESIPNVTTCLHGDYHIGNIIMTDKKDILFIDMGDFAYGDPRFDLACLFFNAYNPLKEAAPAIYHCSPETFQQFWRDFAKHYYHLNSVEEIDQVNEDIKPFAALVVIYYAMRIRVEPFMYPLVKEWLLDKIK